MIKMMAKMMIKMTTKTTIKTTVKTRIKWKSKIRQKDDKKITAKINTKKPTKWRLGKTSKLCMNKYFNILLASKSIEGIVSHDMKLDCRSDPIKSHFYKIRLKTNFRNLFTNKWRSFIHLFSYKLIYYLLIKCIK